MSSDKWTTTIAPCPCGKGKIVADVDSPDNGWSRPSSERRIDCLECARKWVLSYLGESLSDRAASEASTVARSRIRDIDEKLSVIGQGAIDEILKNALQPTFKAEHLLLKGVGVCVEGPIRYKRAREAGQNAGSLCNPLANLRWIALENPNSREQIDRLVSEKAQVQASLQELTAQLNTIEVSSLCQSSKAGAFAPP